MFIVVTVFYNVLNYRIVNDVLQKKTNVIASVKQLLKKLVGEVDTATLEDVTQNAQEYSEDFNDMITGAWTNLMSIEVDLHEQLEVQVRYVIFLYKFCVGSGSTYKHY